MVRIIGVDRRDSRETQGVLTTDGTEDTDRPRFLQPLTDRPVSPGSVQGFDHGLFLTGARGGNGGFGRG